MLFRYRLKKNIICDEEGADYTVYGIEAVAPKGNIIQSFIDIFFSQQKAEQFVSLCNDEELALIHLKDAVEDALT